jgi:Protein of unknown function (DUF1364)
MPRGNGFKRRLPPSRQSEVALGARTLAVVSRRGTYAAPPAAAAIPKTPRREIPHLLAMARGRPCLFRITGVCNRNSETTVAAHSNWPEHGKAMARKADDCFSAWCCFACHTWLDSGSADGEVKKLAFLAAHLEQVGEWRAIAAGLADGTPKDRAAAALALEHLQASPVGHQETPCSE